MLFPKFVNRHSSSRQYRAEIERIDDGLPYRPLIRLGKPGSQPLRLAIDGIQEDSAAARQILARMKYGKQDDEQRDIGNLENPQENFMCGDDAAPCVRATLRLFEGLDRADNASDQQHETGDVEDVDNGTKVMREVPCFAAAVFHQCNKREEAHLNATLQNQCRLQKVLPDLSHARIAGSAGTVRCAGGGQALDNGAQEDEGAEDAARVDQGVVG